MPQILQQLIDWITASPELAYVLIFCIIIATGAGIPIAEEIIVIAAGILVHQGVIDWYWTWITCYIAILIADSIVVYLGWHFGRAVLHRKWVKRTLHPRRVMWARHQIEAHGAWMIAASRFIPGSRWATLLISGMMHIPRWKFLLADSIAASVSVTIQLMIGYYIGRLASDAFTTAERWMTIGSIAVGVGLISGYFYYRKHYGTPGKPIRLGRFRKTRRNPIP